MVKRYGGIDDLSGSMWRSLRIGVAATVALAQERFEGIVGDYFAIWGSESERDSDEFPQWLEQLRKLILIEVGDLWRKGE